jgi:acyl-CoA reductase-like NAD-dependent aldehyde dehydrogenase
MTTANERIPVLVTKAEKTKIAKQAKTAGVSVSEYLRRAAASYNPSEDEEALSAMIDQMLKATERAEAAIDDAIDFVAESNKRIEKMETQHKKNQKVA